MRFSSSVLCRAGSRATNSSNSPKVAARAPADTNTNLNPFLAWPSISCALGEPTGDDADLDRIALLLQGGIAESPLPAEAPNADELNAFLVRTREDRFS